MKQDPSANLKSQLLQLGTYWLPVVVWMGIIFYLSSLPHVPGPPQRWIDFLFKKGLHFSGYGVLAILWRRALRSLPWSPIQREPDHWAVLLAAFVLSVLYAVSDEYHQSLVPGRNSSPFDVLIDSGGALAGLLATRSWTENKT